MNPLRLLQKAPEPVDCIVRTLEGLLERARSGEIRGVVVILEANDVTGHHIALAADCAPTQMVGELDLAKFSVFVETGRIKAPGG